jgi:hypothetical protein
MMNNIRSPPKLTPRRNMIISFMALPPCEEIGYSRSGPDQARAGTVSAQVSTAVRMASSL